MAQFDVYRNSGKDSKNIPFLVDIQYELLANCGTRVVVPLLSAALAKEKKMDFIDKLNPSFLFDDTEVILAAHLLAAVSTRELREKVGSIAYMRSDILTALDFIFAGI